MKSSLPPALSAKMDWKRPASPQQKTNILSAGLTKRLRIAITLLVFVQVASLTKAHAQTCSTIDFSSTLTTSPTRESNSWYTDRYSPNGFTSQQSGGGRANVLKHSIAASDGQTTAHENTQGRKFDLPTGSKVIQVDLYIPSDWQNSGRRMAGLWGTAYNAGNVFTNESYPIIEFASDGVTPRFRGYESGLGTWTTIPTPDGFSYNSWVTLKIELKSDKQYIYSVTANGNTSSISTTSHSSTTEYIGNAILQGHNTSPPGVDYDIYWDNFGATTHNGFISNVQTGELFCTIQSAIDDAETLAGHTIDVPAGTYAENVVLNKGLTLKGASMASTILTGASDYGIYVDADGATILDLTISSTPLQGLLTNCGADNLTVTNVTINNSGKSGFNINGVNGAVLTNVFATKNTGNGISISDSKNVTINGVTTSENAFSGGFGAGIGIFSGGACSATVGAGTDEVHISGTVLIEESVPVYQQGAPISNVVLPNTFSHFVGIGTNDKYYTTSLNLAFTGVPLLAGAMNTKYVQEIATGNLYVDNGMSIQTAINAAAISKTVFVGNGTFAGALNVNKSLTLKGASKSTTILSGSTDVGVYIDADAVTIEDLTVAGAATQGLLTNCGSDNLTITNVAVNNSGKSGFNINGVNTATLTNITATNNAGTGVSISASKNITINEITTSANTFAGGFSSGIGIFSGGACAPAVGPETNAITITGAVNISEPFAIYQQGASISNVTIPADYAYFVGVGTDNKYFTKTKPVAYTIASTLIANPTSPLTVYVEEVASGNHYVEDAIPSAGVTGNYSISIQAAIDYLTPGRKVFVEDGTFNENVIINKTLTLEGIGTARSVINPPASGNTGYGIVLKANDITVKHLKLTNNTTAVGSGIKVGGADAISGLTVDDVEASGNTFGIYVTNDVAGSHSTVFDNVTIKNSDFSNNSIKGIYLERAKNLLIDGVTIDNSGTGNPNANNNAGIDINLKFAAYSGITIKNSTITNSGTGTGSSPDGPAAIAVKARDDASSYNTNPASLTDVLIEGNTISGSTNGIRIGEYGKVNAGPSNVIISKNDLSAAFGNKAFINNTNKNVALVCNWFGTTDFSAIETSKLATGATATGINKLLSVATGNTRSSCTPRECNVTVKNNAETVTYTSGGDIPAGTLKFSTEAGYDTYRWYACNGSNNGSCTFTDGFTGGTTANASRSFSQIGMRGVKLVRTIAGITEECYFFFKMVPYITTGTLTSCSQVLNKNGTNGTNKWFRNGVEIPGQTGNNYTATTNGTYTLKVELSGQIYESTPFEVTAITSPVDYNLTFASATVSNDNSFTLCKNEIVPLQITGTVGQTYTLTRAANAEWSTPIVISGNVGDPAVNLPAQMSWNGNWTLVVLNGSCSKTISFDVTVNQPDGLTNIGTSATVAISAGTNDLISNCAFIGKISSTSLTGSTVSVATTEVSGARKYTITPAVGTTHTANLVLYFSQADFDAFNNASDIDIATSSTDLTGISKLRILHTGSSTETIFPTAVQWNSTKSWWEISFAVSHFSTFELAASNSALPVVLTSFKVVKENSTTQLTWATTSENNSDHFDIQHSVNGKNWLSIGKRDAMGENTGVKTYSFNHATPALGENLYRLKMIDRDGTFAYSSIESVNFGSNQMITLYPNPVSDRLLIDTQQWKNVSGVKLINLNGRTVYSSAKGKLTNSIDVKSFASGTYLVEITHLNGQVSASKIVIVR